MIGAKLIEAAGNGISTVAVAEAIDFDGTNDYLSRSTDLVGNTDTNQMTFSAWMYWDGSSFGTVQNILGLGRLRIFGWNTTPSFITIEAQNSSAVDILSARVEGSNVLTGLQKGWVSFIISFTLGNTSLRSCYINDQLVSVSWLTYTGGSIDTFISGYPIAVARDNGQYGGVQFYKGRLAHVYLDYTYRDLSITANRRLFVTADLKPAADQAALNPILYLPMDDPTQPGLNAGTGGNFTLTGTVARSGRGPNQYNAPYSDFDGSADYLSRTTALTGLADGKQATLAFTASIDSVATGSKILDIGSTTQARFAVTMGNTGELTITGRDSGGILCFSVSLPQNTFVVNRNYNIVLSFDLSNTSNRHLYLNGVLQSPTWGTYTNTDIDFVPASGTLGCTIARNIGSASSFLNGRLGALWFNTSYIDLSVASNLAKFVTGTGIDAKPVDLGANGELPTGTSPLIYLPMYGNNAGKNYGTGGDFTVNSGPYTGARGPNEFWGNLANFNGTTGCLSRTSSVGLSSGKTASGSFAFTIGTTGTVKRILALYNNANNLKFAISVIASNVVSIQAAQSGGPTVLLGNCSTALSTGTVYFVQFCVDLTNTANRRVYINGVEDSVTWTTYTNTNIDFAGASNPTIGANWNGSANVNFFNGNISELYFTTSYIDFSQEANRLKFRDAFGNPVDLTQQIEDAAIPNPAIYMRFPPTAFGTNYGTGGNFTVNGTITDGGQL